MEWSIPTDRLIGPRKLGGRTSKRGFIFQDAYTCLKLTDLLDEAKNVIKVRPEGAQDVDILYADGREEYIQLKDSPDDRYTLAELRPILQSFAIDLLDSNNALKLTFILIARSNNINDAVIRLKNGSPSPKDIERVAEQLAKTLQCSPAPRCLVNLSDAERCDLAKQLLQQTKFIFGQGDEYEGRLSFRSNACIELADHGVAGPDLQNAFNALEAALDSNREFTRLNVEEILKRFSGDAAIALFDGRVEALSDELLSRPASTDRIQRFYSGAPLGWDIIAAHGDIERDQQDELVKLLHQPSEMIRLVCIVAEPGAGKSTFAWRVAAELHKRYDALIIRIKRKEDASIWFRLPVFYQKVNRPFYVLIDDIFRDPDVVNALCELDQKLPITVLATSRSNEYRSIRFEGRFEQVSLKKPSIDEKEKILKRLGKLQDDLSMKQRQRMDAANQLLVLMMELTDPLGRSLERIIQDAIEWLHANDESAFNAYEYLCLVYRYGISIPATLLERLDPQGRFYNLPGRPTVQGLIFYDDDRIGNVRVGHPSLAEIALSFFQSYRSPVSVLFEIIAAIDASNYNERRFAAHLLRVLGQANSPILLKAFPRIEAVIASFRQHATINELSIWRVFYLSIKQEGRAEECVNAAIALAPANQMDCATLLFLHRERGREGDALPAMAKWVNEHPEDNFVRAPYLGLVERKGTAEEVKRALKETADWLAVHPEDSNVRATYLGLVERKGTAEEVKRALKEAADWLAVHPEDNFVRATYLGLVERKGTAEEVKRALKETADWLAVHPEDNFVRATYLGLVERKGTAEEVKRALKETADWLAVHPEDNFVRATYLGLVERKGTAEEVKHALKEAADWLAVHPEDSNVRAPYLGLVERKGTAEEVKRALKETADWLAVHPEDSNVRATYLGLVERKGTVEEVKRALKETADWLEKNNSEKNIWDALIATLIRLDRMQEASKAAFEAFSFNPDDPHLIQQYIRCIRKSSDDKTVGMLWDNLIAKCPKDYNYKIEFAAWLRDHNQHETAEVLYKELIYLPERMIAKKLRLKLHYGYGRLLQKMERPAEASVQFRQTLKLDESHQLAHDGFASTLHALGKIAMHEERTSDANQHFIQSEKEYRQAAYWAGKKGQSKAIFYTHLGWFYIDRERYADAIKILSPAKEENPDYFGNYWGIGRAHMGLGQFQEARSAFRMALERAPEDFQPPASIEIPELLRECENALSQFGS